MEDRLGLGIVVVPISCHAKRAATLISMVDIVDAGRVYSIYPWVTVARPQTSALRS